MPVNDVLNQLQALIRGSAPQLIETANQPLKQLVPFVPGERYAAKVVEQVANGRFLVQVGEQKLDLNLPRNTQPGQNIELRFVSASPRLTFVLSTALPQTGGQLAGQGQNPQAPVNFSDGSRYLNALLDRVQTLAKEQVQTQNKPQAQATLGLQVARPVLEGAPPAGAQFAALLKDAVGKSGLFYESHQAQWAAGDKSLSALLREPQGRLSEPRAHAAAAQQANPNQGAQPDPALQVKASAAQLLASAGLPESKSAEPVHPQTAPLVQQQLAVLDTRQLVWQGQVWPGQELRWQIEERAAQEGDATVEREWQTRLDLQLPRLGEVQALLQISPRGELRIAVTAHSPEIAQTLRDASAALNQSLASAGLQLAQLEVTEVASDG